MASADRFLDERLHRGQAGEMSLRSAVDNRVRRIVRRTHVVRCDADNFVQAILELVQRRSFVSVTKGGLNKTKN